MPGYVYGGTQFDAHLPIVEPSPRAKTTPRKQWRPPAQCGTNSGYAAHRTKAEPQCQPCKDAHNAYKREWKIRHKAGKIKTGWTEKKCGTLAGTALHYRHGVPLCDACREVSRRRAKERRDEARKAAA